jgi:hypothetical protein
MTRSVWNGGVNSSSGCCIYLLAGLALAATGLGVLSRLT